MGNVWKMDDMTTITITKAYTKRLLGNLQENIEWVQMEIKPSKSYSISTVKGRLTERFFIIRKITPTILQKPINSLDHWYITSKPQTRWNNSNCRLDAISDLKKIDNTALPGKFKLWCFQFGLLPRFKWPVTI